MASLPKIPHFIQVAHWLYEQQFQISAREASELLGGSAWSMGQVFSKIKEHTNIFMIDEQRIRSRGGMQTLIRVVYIFPYEIDQNNKLHRKSEDRGHHVPLTWDDLLRKSWSQLIEMNT